MGLQSPHLSLKLGWRKQTKGNGRHPTVPNFSVDQVKSGRELDT